MSNWSVETFHKFAPRPIKHGPKQSAWDGYIGAMIEHGEELFAEFGIDTALELQHWLAQVAHESGGFTIVQESMNYSASRIMEIFGVGRHSASVTQDEALRLAGNPQALAERVYGLGNPRKARDLGNNSPGDGFRYIGLGLQQITGKTDHERYFQGDYSPRSMIRAALMEWDAKQCNDHACRDDLKKITRLINGGYNGIEDRRQYLDKAKRVWPQFPFSQPVSRPSNAGAYSGGVDAQSAPKPEESVSVEQKSIMESKTAWASTGSSGTSADTLTSEIGRSFDMVKTSSTPDDDIMTLFGKFVLACVTSRIFWASLFGVILSLYVLYDRYHKPDIKKPGRAFSDNHAIDDPAHA